MTANASGTQSELLAAEREEIRRGRRKLGKFVVPLTVASVAVATVGLVPALADSGNPDLPKISAGELIEKIAASDTDQLSGTVRISTDLGIPALGTTPFGKSAGDRESADPQARMMELFTGGPHTLRIAVDGPEKQKVSFVDGAGEYTVLRDGGEIWAYDSAGKRAFHTKESTGTTGRGHDKKDTGHDKKDTGELKGTPKELAQQALDLAGPTTEVTVGGTARIAGREAYELVLKPKGSGSTVESVRIAVDAKTGTPLSFSLDANGGGKPIAEAVFTQVDFGKPEASTFKFSVPKGVEVSEADNSEILDSEDQESKVLNQLPMAGGLSGDASGETEVIGEGWTAVAVTGLPEGESVPSVDDGKAGDGKGESSEAQDFMDKLGDKASGKFGKGTVFKTRLVNALMTEDGKVYVGAVTPEKLIEVADAAAK